MDRVRGMLRRVRALLFRRSAERDLHDELQFHIDHESAELHARGMEAHAARTAALRAFGGVDRYGEEARDARGVAWWDDVRRDVRLGFRQLRHNPRFATAAILTLGIGIGASTAIFTAVNAVLLGASPFAAPDRLVVIWQTDRASGTEHEPGSWPDIVDMRARTRALSGIAALLPADGTLTGQGVAEQISVLEVTPDITSVLGIRPLIGRAFEPGSGPLEGAADGMLSERYWRSRFNAAPDMLGATITVSGRPITIIGILPADADLGVAQIHARADYSAPLVDPRVDLWLALEPNEAVAPRQTHPFLTIGRLRPDATIAEAQGELAALMAELEAQYPENANRGVHVQSHGDVTFGPVRPVLGVLMGGVALVLLIACVNTANLLLARTATRTREVALRSALGAARVRIQRQFLIEGLVLAFCGALVGVAMAYGGLHALLALAPGDLPRIENATLDVRVLAFTAFVTLLIAVAFGMTPVLGASWRQIRHTLGSQATARTTESRESRRFRNALVATEVAFAVLLSIGAVLMLRSVQALTRVDPGFRPAGLVKAEYQLAEARYPMDFSRWPALTEINDFHARVLQDVQALPGIEHAALSARHPLDPGFTNSFVIVGREAESADFPEIRSRMITPGYLETVGVPLLDGRDVAASDIAGQPPVAIVNEAARARYFQERSPIGETIRFWGVPWRIVGVMGDERFRGLAADTEPAVYVPLAQAPQRRAAVLVRARGDAGQLSAQLHGVIRRLDPEIALTGVETMERTIATSIARPRFTAALLGLFGAVAVLLSLIGVHGVLSYTVAQRSSEMGIRMALGASRPAVIRLVLRDGLRYAVAGVILGLLAAAAGTRLLAGILYGVQPHDPVAFISVTAGVLVLAAAACMAPALRAARAAPLTALRAD